MDTIIKDIRYAFRILGRNLSFTIVAVLALALGIGANTAIFSVVNAVLLKPLPYPNPDKLVTVWGQFVGIGIPDNRNNISPPEFIDIQRMNNCFTDVAAIATSNLNLTGTGQPERLAGAIVSPSLFSILGVNAQVGRVFLPEESKVGNDKVILLGHGLWVRRFASDSRIVGTKIGINGEPYMVVGVLPAGFQYPQDVDVWTPLAFTPDQLTPNFRGSHGLVVVGRIKPELSGEQVRFDLASLTQRIIEQNRQYPYTRFSFAVLSVPLIEDYVGGIQTALWILMAAVAVVLLIACANVANLLLVRASAREREIAIRTAIGAGKGRLVRQLLTESVILSLIGGLTGLLLARIGLNVLIAVGEKSFPRVAAATLDGWVLAFTMLVSLLTGVLFGIVPALQSARSITHESLKEGGRGSTTGAGSHRLRRALVVVEVALSLVLLAGAGLLLKSFAHLMQVDPGFRADGVLTMRVSLPPERYDKPELVSNFYRSVLDRVSHVPGVQAAGAISLLPLIGVGSSGTTTVDTKAVPTDQLTPEADRRVATPGTFQAMGIGLVRGRYFDDRDNATGAPVAIIDETMAQTYWPGDDPIGKRLKFGGLQSTAPWITIVGEVKHVHYRTLEAKSRVQVYVPNAQRPSNAMSLVIRTPEEPLALAATVQREVLAVDSDQPVYKIATMQQLIADSVARRRLSMLLLAIFAGAALLLAAVGIYGIISYSVAQRSHEMGIRMALGASRWSLLRLMLGQSLWMTLTGAAIGLVGSIVLTRFMATMLFDVKASDPSTFALVALLLIVVALAASYIPARRATGVDPVNALRDE